VTLQRKASVAAVAALACVPIASDANVGKSPAHDAVLRSWIVEESCDEDYRDSDHATDDEWAGGDELRNLPVGKPRVAGRFARGTVERVTVLARSDDGTRRLRTRVSKTGRFALDLPAMPERIAFAWRGRGDALHRTPFYGPFHSGCNDAGPPRPPGVPADWVPVYETECGDAGPACPEPTWAPPPSPRR
jgi:hypothetical protein